MPVAERTVRHLHLRAASAAQARRGALCIEDALRCASLPGAGAPLLLVRRLALGRIDAEGPSQTVALRIEQRLRELAPQWRRGQTDEADDADDNAQGAEAVWFADRAQALVSLALRLAEGRPASAWYWPRLLPADLAPPGAAPPTLRAALLALAREPSAPVALPATVVALLRRAGRAPLRALLNADQAQAVLRAAGLAARSDGWVDALLARAQAVSPAGSPASPALRSRREQRANGLAAPAIDAAQRDLSTPARHPAGRAEAATPVMPVLPTVDALPIDPAPAAPVLAANAAPRIVAPLPFDLALPTAAGGCLFLLPLLARLGFAARAAEADPANAGALAARVLRQALRRLRLQGDDPAWALCAAAPDAALDATATAWLHGVRHALRRRFGIGLASLVSRPGRLVLTRSHAEMHFALAATDLRLRRHGLDLDPGWLPWFGRVVAFHFDA